MTAPNQPNLALAPMSQPHRTSTSQAGPPLAVQRSAVSAQQPLPQTVTFPFPGTVEFDAKGFCEYLMEFVPKDVEFIYDNHGYISSVSSVGVQFQITKDWCDARKVVSGPKFSVKLSVLLSAILDHLQTVGTQGFGWLRKQAKGPAAPAQRLGMVAWWWSVSRTGDGIVWPNAFGDLVLRWIRPAHIRSMKFWIDQSRPM
jgi:hypothetical protein